MKRKNKTKFLIGILFLLIGYFVFCSLLSLKKVGDRANPFSMTQKLKMEIKQETKGMTADEIRIYSIRKTAKSLSFTSKNNLDKGEANCVGYAQICASICNYAFNINGLNATAKPVYGYVMLYKLNLCEILKSIMPSQRWANFVKDHDFVEFKLDGKTIFADASMYDFLKTDGKTIKDL